MKLYFSILLFALATPLCFAQSAEITTSQNNQPQVLHTQPLTAAQLHALVQEFESPGSGTGVLVQTSQTSCPVVLLSAFVDTPARYLPVDEATREVKSRSLDLTFQNMSGKKIESAALKVQVKVKKSIYDLDSSTLTVHLEIPEIEVASGELSRRIPLRVPAFGVGQVVLEQVTYADGSTWSAMTGNTCGLNGPDSLMRLAK
jgi:hypothetical protein